MLLTLLTEALSVDHLPGHARRSAGVSKRQQRLLTRGALEVPISLQRRPRLSFTPSERAARSGPEQEIRHMTSINAMPDDKLAAWIDMMNDDGEFEAALAGVDELKTRQEWAAAEEVAMDHERRALGCACLAEHYTYQNLSLRRQGV